MALITSVPEPNLWEQICKEFAAERPPFLETKVRQEDEASSVSTQLIDFDPAKHNPVFYGKMHYKVDNVDFDDEFDAAVSHPAAAGYCFLDRPSPASSPPPPPPPDKKKCSPRQYLEYYIFPVLTPALEHMLQRAKEEKCFERRRTAFNALDCLTEYLFGHNPSHPDRLGTQLEDIPFVKEWWKEHPRAPLPMSLLWSDEEAALVIQAHFRGFCVRRRPEIQELRQWQREWREESRDARERVSDFWEKMLRPSPGKRQAEEDGEEEEEEKKVEEKEQEPEQAVVTDASKAREEGGDNDI